MQRSKQGSKNGFFVSGARCAMYSMWKLVYFNTGPYKDKGGGGATAQRVVATAQFSTTVTAKLVVNSKYAFGDDCNSQFRD